MMANEQFAARIRQSLREIAHEEIPDTMNLLPVIQEGAALAARKSRRSRGLSLLLLAVLCLGAGAGVYALAGAQQQVDPGLAGVAEADLVTTVNASQTIDDVTLTLEWAYADASRIAIGYSVTAPEGAEDDLYPAAYRITDAGDSFSLAGNWAEGGDSSALSRTSEFTSNFNVVFEQNAPQILDLTVKIQLASLDETGTVQDSGIGFGGGGEYLDSPGIYVEHSMPIMTDPVGPFTFTLDLPHYSAIILEEPQTVESNGISMTLDRIVVAPSQTIARICYDLPDDRDWMPYPVRVGEEAVFPPFHHDLRPSSGDTFRCGRLFFHIPYLLEPITFTFSVESLRISGIFTEARAEQFRQQLAEQGVVVEILSANGEGFDYDIVSQPDGVDIGALIQEAFDVFNDYYAGPWTFTVEIPGYAEGAENIGRIAMRPYVFLARVSAGERHALPLQHDPVKCEPASPLGPLSTVWTG
jgi:hypothetical protein